MVRAKVDAENGALRPLLLKKPKNLSLTTEARVLSLITADRGNRVRSARYEKRGKVQPENLSNNPASGVQLLKRFITGRSADHLLDTSFN